MAFIARQVTLADWAEFWPLMLDMGTDDDEPTAARRFAVLVEDPRWGLLGLEKDGRLIGYAALQDYGPHLRAGDVHRIARMHDLYVLPDERRSGAGRALMTAVERWASERVRYVEWQAGETT